MSGGAVASIRDGLPCPHASCTAKAQEGGSGCWERPPSLAPRLRPDPLHSGHGWGRFSLEVRSPGAQCSVAPLELHSRAVCTEARERVHRQGRRPAQLNER